jgi:catechol 2,3-dioxygenase-like lactoylglutathione lyase family enzyme
LYVDDLERAARFYEEVCDFKRMIGDDRFCALSVADRDVLLLFLRGATLESIATPGGVIPAHDGSGTLHVAFAIPASAEAAWQRRLEENHVEVESMVDWPRGGRSTYFRDPDQHLVELVTPGCWSIY